MYIPRFNAITDSPSPRTSDSVSALSIIAKVESIGVKPAFTISLKTGLSCSISAMYDEIVDSSNAIIETSAWFGCAKAVGGDFEKFTFSEDQTGPTVIKFENIRNTGQETEFALVVVDKTVGEKKVEVIEEPTTAPQESSEEGGGCLIATAAYGSELAPQVQMLREIRDNQLMNTESGTTFMSGFNELYYTFSPTIADMERESPMFKEVVKLGLTPMISTLSLMENAETESEVLGLGLSVIALNLGMYIGLPAFGIVKVIQFRKNWFKYRNSREVFMYP